MKKRGVQYQNASLFLTLLIAFFKYCFLSGQTINFLSVRIRILACKECINVFPRGIVIRFLRKIFIYAFDI